jgi:hypothetical protein
LFSHHRHLAFKLLILKTILLFSSFCLSTTLLRAQGLTPTSPAKEFIHLNGQVIAVENAVPGGTGNGSGTSASCLGLRSILGSISPSTFTWNLDYNGDW